MAISKIKGGAINDDAIATAKIQDDAVTSAKIVDSYTTSLQTNPEFSGTEAARMPVGTTAERANAQSGDIRFNSTLSLMEYYDGTNWKSIDTAPVVSSISPDNIADSDDDVDITITGSFFASGATVKAIGSDASEISAGTVTFNSSTELVANFDGTSFSDALEDYDIQVTNPSGLSGVSSDALAVNATPTWTVASGSLGTIYDSTRTGISITTGATDDEGATLTYALSGGTSLPSGLSLNTSTGTITGDADAVGSDTTSTFTLSVTDGTNTTTREYSITIKAPVVQEFTTVTSGTFSVPTGVTSVDVLVVAGGGGGGAWIASGGGAGGLIYRPAFPVTPGGSVSYTVGAGGGGAYNNGSYSDFADNVFEFPQRGQEAPNAAKIGQDSVFGTLTALGGGRGGSYSGPEVSEPGHVHTNGGSGGGAPGSAQTYPQWGVKISDRANAGIQSQQPGDSGTYGFGSAGGIVAQSDPFGPIYYGGGGGGAAGVGSQGQGQTGPAGPGGVGKQYDISGQQVYYAGGGGGGAHQPGQTQVSNGGQGGGGDGFNGQAGENPSRQATANRGGGGGGQGAPGNNTSQGGDGGSGIVIVKY